MSGRQLASALMTAVQASRVTCTHHGRCAHVAAPRNEYAVEMVASTLRFGPGVTQEVGMDIANMNKKLTLVVTDPRVASTPAVRAVCDSLTRNNQQFDVFDGVCVEPTDLSIQEAMVAARRRDYDSFIAVGGGSVMDTAKCAAIFSANPAAQLWDYTTPPFGKGEIPKVPMDYLICVPTTAGTGSEMTTVSVFDLHDRGIKTAIRLRALKPHLAIVDPLNVASMPRHVAIYSGFDVLCHALESYTAKPFNQRICAENPKLRPVYQGSNPISDVWSQHALRIMKEYFKRSVDDPSDVEAQTQMLLASSYAGMGFGNAGVHLCHGLSYPISGQVKTYSSPDYDPNHALIPHGLSVVLTAPSVFEFTSSACPDRHSTAASLLGAEEDRSKRGNNSDAGVVLADIIRDYMQYFDVPNGLNSVGFSSSDTHLLAAEAVNSLSAISLCPKPAAVEALETIYEKSQSNY